MNVDAELAKIRDDLAAMQTHTIVPSEWYQRIHNRSRARMGIIYAPPEPAKPNVVPCSYCSAMREARPGKCENCGAAWKVEP